MSADYYLVSAALKAHRLRPERTYIFGREEEADIVLQDALVSRRHAELRWMGDAWQIEDLGSRNGVFIDSARIPGPMRLADGCQIQIGGQVFRLHILPPGADPLSLGKLAPQLSTDETRGHDHRLQETALGGATFSGEVSEGGVLELLQFFSAGNKTGRLDFIGGTDPASVWILDGNPIHAAFGSAVGVDALIALVQAPPPRFTFTSGASVPTERSLEGTMNSLVMKVARQLDQKKV
jgi:hypothetical protein